ncbi:MarR family winged helix-turn-helix transcriptional regulator [Thalassospira sp. TSL5-1]|uniref:MarR family winged helix-turn-helix transcriptional regulator n=1 Tax=Thalassospira sp. TSL5-1 TaxID=1544451 RepID=UPI00093EDD17|nr:MarR family transcriptional regulator [Thalassospira sp. TSL5-1]OKH89943.1 MarR family transcriptional regulator [Thalassospira sp. TSL5-1]
MDKLHDALISIRRILRASDIHAKRLSKLAGLKTSQLLVLQSLDDAGEMTVGEIAAKVNLAQASTTSLVDKLQSMGLVKRARGHSDKRKVYVRLTDMAHDVLGKAPMALHDRFSEKFKNLEEWEQSFLVAALQRVSTMMDAGDIDVAPLLDHEAIVEKSPDTGKNV